MTKRYLWNWAVWIGVVSGIYCFLYSLTPLADYGVMPATFTALPIFFTAGAQRKEYFHYAASNIMGVVWGLLYLMGITAIAGYVGAAAANGIVVGLVTIVCCAIHFIPTGATWLNKPAAMFGAISSTFWIGGDKTKVIPLMITLVLGVTLALVCQEGTNFLTEEGKWTWPSKK
ncbi:DUF1097 domain-containing protein [Petralouisia muris]|jgi:hypothetical protein|uniref:DUF1097 domain-containing protein n=1 Tax=Petralouisia muris TaxID=3032872 RepID=UPI0014426E39|nr:DUF1097 domain-containing protein [Petralouisia muris]